MKIERENGIPIYVQVKKYILDEIKQGVLKTGDKLPTERELSQKLRVSRNTISTAYDLLEQEGVLVSYQGKGTFVAQEDKTWQQEREKTKIIQLVDIALEEAIEMGLSTKEFIALVQERVREKEEFIKNINAIFVECNREQAKLFSKELSRKFNLRVMPATLADLRDQAAKDNISKTNLIITPFNHVNEVKSIIGYRKKEVIGISSNPNLATIVKIAKYPKETRFGQISLSKEFQFKVQYTLKLAGLDDLKICATTSDKEEDILKVIQCSDVIIVSPGRAIQVEKLVGNKKEIVRFDYVLDHENVKTLLSKIIEIKNNL